MTDPPVTVDDPQWTITVDGRSVPVRPGQTVAAALIAAGRRGWRPTRGSGQLRGLFCGIGACFDCLVAIGGVRSVRACLAVARPGDVVTTGAAAGAPRPVGDVSTVEVAAQTASPAELTVELTVELAVVGAGPAGLSAAVTAADAGLTVAVLDLAGQVLDRRSWPGGAGARRRFADHRQTGRVVHLARHAVTAVSRQDGVLLVRALAGERDPAGRVVRARTLLVATGAHDRQVPFPGWTLPGVFTAGGVQSLLKDGVAAGRRVVVAGTGPFLLSVAAGLLAAGVEVAAVVEANGPWRYARHPRAVAGAAGRLPQALGYAARLARHRVPYLPRHAVVEACGEAGLRGVRVRRLDRGWRAAGPARWIDADTLAVGYGFTPQLDLLLPLGCAATVTADGTLAAVVDGAQQTTVDGVYAAGETTGVGGAELAAIEGRLAAAAVVRRLRGADPLPPRQARRLRAGRSRQRRFAAALADVHPVRDGWTGWLADDTTVCRCEEVDCGRIRSAVRDLGAGDARTVKLLARPGMGWCQGRICGTAVAALVAQAAGRPVTEQDLAGLAHRVIAQPMPLGVLADLADPANDGMGEA